MPLFVYRGYFRHYGHIFLLFIAILWISNLEEGGNNYLIKKSKRTTKILFHTFMIIILLSSLLGAAIASYFDFKYPFSNAKYVSEYIEDNYDLDNIALAGYWDSYAVAVSAYLGKDSYCPQEGEVIPFVPWNSPKRLRDLSDEEIFSDVIELLKSNETIILMLTHKPDPVISDKYKFKEIASFENSITGQEDYYIYEWKRESLKPVYSSDRSNFIDFWIPVNNCRFVLTRDKVILEATENDPYFESIFPIQFQKGEYIVINVVISSEIDSFLQVYYGRKGRGYIESDSDKQEIFKGENNIFIIVQDPEDIERLRIDPVEIDHDSIIKKIDILKLK
ncbi:MAG: hypothetical protein KAI62_08715 [Actinomycetia bacterium]|nr:hypothetical protein [Actinomycetes bacterium]